MFHEAFRDASRSIVRKWKRSLLTMAGIAIGVMSVLLISSIGEYGTQAVTNELESLGLGGIMISTSDSSRYPSISEEEIKTIRKSSQVQYAMPLMVLYSTMQANETVTNALLLGVDEGAGKIISLDVIYGKGILRSDVNSKARICLIDQSFAILAFGTENAVGQKVQLGINGIYHDYRVVGITKTGSGLLQSSLGSYIPSFVYLPHSSLQSAVGQTTFQQVAVRIGRDIDPDTAGESIVRLLEHTTGIHGKYVAENLSQQKEGLYGLLNTVTLALTAIGAISLVVACLSIMTTMMVSVRERTREIGIKKSLGATKLNILSEFLCEAGMISVLGSLLGAVAAGVLVLILSAIFALSVPIRLDILGGTLLVTVVTGMIFGVYPAFRAASLKPVDALRME
ncbi:MAG: ABC transporter permease [Firmicutes bacterium]|nr:ABC transporter permease [Bacillota bacterium]